MMFPDLGNVLVTLISYNASNCSGVLPEGKRSNHQLIAADTSLYLNWQTVLLLRMCA